MKITTDTPELLILRFTRWKSPLIFGGLTLYALWIAARIALNIENGFVIMLVWLALTAGWMLPVALARVEKSMLVLNATTGEAELRHRDIRGLYRHRWPLEEVQSTRVTRDRPKGPAIDDPERIMTLYVRHGMDEGRHKLSKRPMPSGDVLSASARVSDWMKHWRASLDSGHAKP